MLTDFTLMYTACVGVLLKRDAEAMSGTLGKRFEADVAGLVGGSSPARIPPGLSLIRFEPSADTCKCPVWKSSYLSAFRPFFSLWVCGVGGCDVHLPCIDFICTSWTARASGRGGVCRADLCCPCQSTQKPLWLIHLAPFLPQAVFFLLLWLKGWLLHGQASTVHPSGTRTRAQLVTAGLGRTNVILPPLHLHPVRGREEAHYRGAGQNPQQHGGAGAGTC